jgi:lipopolysaccharide transport system permease protein
LETPISISDELPLRVITPNSGVGGIGKALRSLRSEWPQSSHLAWRFFLRDMRADHRQSVLGYLWLVFPPLANALVWIFLAGQKVVRIDSGAVAYPVFVLAGTLIWASFNTAVMAMLNVANQSRGILAKVNFPHESLVYSAFLKASVDSIIASLLLIPALWYFHVSIVPTTALYPVAVLAALVIGSALGLLMHPIAALYSDVGRGIQLVLRFGFFLAPVVFPLPTHGIARKIMLLNPATPAVLTGRAWLTGNSEAVVTPFCIIALISLLILVLALLLYKVTVVHLIERLSS